MERVTLARNAMATRFEFVLVGANAVRMRAAGEEALDEIARIENQLSLYRPGSEIARINARAGEEAVRVSPEVLALLLACRNLSDETDGLFDITVAPLVRCWGFMKGTGEKPQHLEIEQARQLVGMHLLHIDPHSSTVQFKKPGMMLDLGSIGKGRALDAAAEIIWEGGVESALLHGGTSTIRALGTDPEQGSWKVAIELPASDSAAEPEVISVVSLENQSLSVSAVWGKHFVIDGQTYGHVINPKTGWPAREALLGAIVVDSAARSDALSTGVLLGDQHVLQALREENAKFLQVHREARVFHGMEPVRPV